MALKALDIFKLLPKTNCKKCGCPTCLAFAMKLAAKQATLDQCPDVTADAKAALDGAAAPPIRLVAIGTGDTKLEIGNETVMFRHEESFYHAPGIGSLVSDTLDDAALAARVAALAKLSFVRVGMRIRADVVAVENASGSAANFVKAVTAVKALKLPIVLIASDAGNMAKALECCAETKPLIHAATPANWEAFAKLAKERSCPLAVQAPDLEALSQLTGQIKAAGVEDMVLDLSAPTLSATLQGLTAARNLALKKKCRPLGYPLMTVCRESDELANVADCCTYVAKYSGIVLTPLYRPEHILPMLTARQNLYADPRKPIQVESRLSSVGAVTPDSPLLVTTNFSLTYYTIEGEVEASRVPAYIAVIDTEGTSVLTAFAADKFTSEKIAAFLNQDAIKQQIKHRKVIIPGYVAVMSGGLQEESGWEVMVGPREASGIAKYLKTVWQAA